MREMGLPPEPVPPNKKPKNAATTIGVRTLTTSARRSRKNICDVFADQGAKCGEF